MCKMLIDRKLSTAEKLRKIGNFEQAIIIYEEILFKFPLNKRAQLGKLSYKICTSEGSGFCYKLI